MRQRLQASRQDPDSVDAGVLEAVPYGYAGRGLWIDIDSEEFTHICPMTGLPDYGRLTIRYIPDETIVELKSLKYYLVQYRQVGIFYEHVVHRILDDLRALLAPREIVVRYATSPRGGLSSRVEARWPAPDTPRAA